MNIYLLDTIKSGKLLADLLVSNIEIKGIIGLGNDGKLKTSEYYDYSEFCKKHRINFIALDSYSLNSEADKLLLEDVDIDLLIVAGWQRLVPGWFIKKCTIGVIGAHGSHEGIVRGRGRSPQNWALLTGQKKFVFSIFWIEEGVDSGNIIDTQEFEYDNIDNIMTSYVKLSMCMARMIITNIQNGRIENKAGKPQSGEEYYLPQRVREDGLIDWNRDAQQIYNFIRALSAPYPGAYTIIEGMEFIIETAIPINNSKNDLLIDVQPGTVISVIDKCVLVKCKSGLLLIKECTNQGLIYEGMVFESVNYKSQIQEIIERHKMKYNTRLSDLVLNELNE